MDGQQEEYLKRIAEALEDQGKAYAETNAQTLAVMKAREERDLAQIERIKERHEWDREAHKLMLQTEQVKLEKEQYWKKTIEDKLKENNSNIIR